jgi:3-oxoacyl-[acyl-carrier-protein] synthase II
MKIAITGAGLLTTLGIGACPTFENMLRGQVSAGPEVPGFDPGVFLGDKGIRHFDRTALLLASAAKMAAQQSGLSEAGYRPDEIGVVVGSTHGSIQAIAEFDQESVREGPNYVNPQDFANTVISQPASRMSVIFGATGLNTTIATGAVSALDALGYGLTMLRLGRIRALLCGSGIGYSPEIERGYAQAGRLVVSKNGAGPFASERKGPKFGEGAAVFVLEDAEKARDRQAAILGFVAGVGSVFQAGSAGLIHAVREALGDAGLEPENISCVISFASGSPLGDMNEGEALSKVLTGVPITAPKSQTRDCLEASGAIHMAIALLSIQTGSVTPIPNLGKADAAFDALDLVREQPRRLSVEHVLVTARDDSGHNAAVVISAPS